MNVGPRQMQAETGEAKAVPIWSRQIPPPAEPALAALALEARRDLARLNFPPANWVLATLAPDGSEALDALIVGAGMMGQTAAFALIKQGVRRLRIIDRAARGLEGPWDTYARMEILRSPKHLTGPDLGVPSLTYRAWYEAQHGSGAWEAVYKVHRLEWRDYLLWVRDTIALPVENQTSASLLEPAGTLLRVRIDGPRGAETLFCRKIILSTGREGAGGERLPSYPSLAPDTAARGRTVFHSSDEIGFDRLAGRRVLVVGASASAFDNAARALEAGAAEVVMSCRRPFLPQVNKSRWMGFPAFLQGFPYLDDRTRWRFLAYTSGLNTPPPFESVLRCETHPRFRLRLGNALKDVRPTPAGVEIVDEAGSLSFDAVIFATGFRVDLKQCQLVDGLPAMVWADRVPAAEAKRHPELARFPYLDPGFAMTPASPEAPPSVSNVHLFNYAATVSHGPLVADIPGLAPAAERLAKAVSGDLFSSSIDRLYDEMVAFEEPELLPTSFFVPADTRRNPPAPSQVLDQAGSRVYPQKE